MNKKTLIAIASPRQPDRQPRQGRVILKVAHFWPATALSQQKVLEPWCAKIAAESNNPCNARSTPPCSWAARRRS